MPAGRDTVQAAIDDNKRAIDEAAALGAEPRAGGRRAATRLARLAAARAMFADGIAAVLPHARANKIPLAIEPLHPMYAATAAA